MMWIDRCFPLRQQLPRFAQQQSASAFSKPKIKAGRERTTNGYGWVSLIYHWDSRLSYRFYVEYLFGSGKLVAQMIIFFILEDIKSFMELI